MKINQTITTKLEGTLETGDLREIAKANGLVPEEWNHWSVTVSTLDGKRLLITVENIEFKELP